MDQDKPRKGWLPPKGIFEKFVLSFVGLVVLVLAVDGVLETWFTYRETTQNIEQSLSEKAEATVARIQQDRADIERQLSWVTRASSTSLEQRSADYALLLQQVPAIDRLLNLDGSGRERLRVTRQGAVAGSNADYSGDPRFTETRKTQVWVSPVYFDGLNPFMAVAMPHSGSNAASTVAEINLKSLASVVERGKIGADIEAYIVDPRGRLLAHSDQKYEPGMNFATLSQVASGMSAEPKRFGKDPEGRSVLSASASMPDLNWHVFYEMPLSKALEPVYGLLYRTVTLLVLGIALSVIAGMILARHLVRPIRALQTGARQLEANEFGHRIEVHTGDEIEELADHFNRMSDRLRESYRGLEKKVEARTHELAVANQHKTEFFANMSHELRTPLNAVLGYAELLADGLYGAMPEKALGVLERIQTNGKHLLGLINDVLDISKIEAGHLALALDDYSVENVVQSVVTSTETLAQAKGIEVKTHIPGDLPAGRGDERRLTQVLLNLVSNAIKFTDKGAVTIDVAAVDGEFKMSVKDTGPGIAPVDQERIFEQFQQVDSSSTRKKGGTGLGLSISRQLVDMHGGRIDLDSTPGVGSTFTLVVPIRVNEQRQPA